VPLSISGEASLVTLDQVVLKHPKPYEDHHRNAGHTHSNSVAFQPWSHKLKPEEEQIRLLIHTHAFTPELTAVFPHPPPLCGSP
jgi:hypothetical protein